MIAVMDYIDNVGHIQIHAGERVPDGLPVDPQGLAIDERDAEEKLRDIAALRLAEAKITENEMKFDQLMYDYYRSMSLATGFKYLRKQKEREV